MSQATTQSTHVLSFIYIPYMSYFTTVPAILYSAPRMFFSMDQSTGCLDVLLVMAVNPQCNEEKLGILHHHHTQVVTSQVLPQVGSQVTEQVDSEHHVR